MKNVLLVFANVSLAFFVLLPVIVMICLNNSEVISKYQADTLLLFSLFASFTSLCLFREANK